MSDGWKEADELQREVNRLRGMLEWCAQQVWDNGLSDIDGADWQDQMQGRGLLVEVPASESFKKEYGYDTMMALSWSDHAQRAAAQPAGHLREEEK